MTFKQEMKEEAKVNYGELIQMTPDPELTPAFIFHIDEVEKIIETTINATLKEVEESLGEEYDMQRAIDTGSDAGAGVVIGHNTLHKKLSTKLKELRQLPND